MMLLTTVTRSIGTWYPVLGVYHIHRKDGRTQGHTPGTRYTHMYFYIHVMYYMFLIYNINKPGPSNSFTFTF
jgi:hypothetical protein